MLESVLNRYLDMYKLNWIRSKEKLDADGFYTYTSYKYKDYEIRSIDGSYFIEKAGERLGIADSLKKAKVFVILNIQKEDVKKWKI